MVTVRSKPSEVGSTGLLRLDTWTNLASGSDTVTPDRLLAIFVKVSLGNRRGKIMPRDCRTKPNLRVKLYTKASHRSARQNSVPVLYSMYLTRLGAGWKNKLCLSPTAYIKLVLGLED